jgi:uncharacterized Zn-binding protein involved in type VI secretion
MAGKPIATVGSMHVCPMVTGLVPHVGGPIAGPGAPNVLINGKPAALMGDMAVCVGPPDVVAQGNPAVLINGVPVVCQGDLTAHGGVVMSGEANILISTATPSPQATMPIEDIPFPEIKIIDKIFSGKHIKEAKVNQDKLKEEAYKDEEHISLTSTVIIEQFIEFCKETERVDFISLCKEVYGNTIDEESFQILQEKAVNNEIKQPEIKTTKGYVQNDVYYSFKEGSHVIQVTERIIKASKENKNSHDRLMKSLANSFHDYIKYIIDNECLPIENS